MTHQVKGDYATASFDKDICKYILSYLLSTENHTDNLDSIVLGVYEQEIMRLNDIVLENLGYLVAEELVLPIPSSGTNQQYRLADDADKIDQIKTRFDIR